MRYTCAVSIVRTFKDYIMQNRLDEIDIDCAAQSTIMWSVLHYNACARRHEIIVIIKPAGAITIILYL